LSVIDCETAGTWRQDIQSGHYQSYGQELSFGVAQIHLPSHPTITKEQAINPLFSLNWMAEQWSQGNQWMWSCYNQKYAKK